MKRWCKAVAGWLLAGALLVAALGIGVAALTVLIVALPVVALLARAFRSKNPPSRAVSGRILEGEFRRVHEEKPGSPVG